MKEIIWKLTQDVSIEAVLVLAAIIIPFSVHMIIVIFKKPRQKDERFFVRELKKQDEHIGI